MSALIQEAAVPGLPRGEAAVLPSSLWPPDAPACPRGEAVGFLPCLPGDMGVLPNLPGDVGVLSDRPGDMGVPPACALDRGSGGPDERTCGGKGDLCQCLCELVKLSS